MSVSNGEGVRRKIDPMGRVTLPKDMIEKYRMKVGDYVQIIDKGGQIVIHPLAKRCVICAGDKDLVPVRDESICLSCLQIAGAEARAKSEVFEVASRHLKLIR